MDSTKSFEFVSYKADLQNEELLFSYRFKTPQKDVVFVEKILLPQVPTSDIPPELLDTVMHSLHIMLGISYWKVYCPQEIVVSTKPLSQKQAEFFNTVYTKGLGEFFYKNTIDFRGLIQFPYSNSAKPNPVSLGRKNRSLVGIGGGKDSIVSAELLKKHNKDFSLLLVETQRNHFIPQQVAELIDKPELVIRRVVDKQLFELNKEEGSYNGHIPISAIYAFIGILVGVLYDYKYVIVSNEKSLMIM